MIFILIILFYCDFFTGPGFSAPSETTREGIIGTIVIEETCDVTTDVKTRSTSTSGTSTVSFVENVDGSFIVYQYINDVLTDEHSCSQILQRRRLYFNKNRKC